MARVFTFDDLNLATETEESQPDESQPEDSQPSI